MGPWGALALLFSVRATMAFQFQSVASVGPTLLAAGAIGLADLGVLVGLYYAPGAAVALPGGAAAARWGDRATILGGLALMALGGAVMAAFPAWEAQVAGRVVSGVGGAVMNVLMSKMVADRFAAKDLSLAMGLFVNSWPVGIAVCLLVAPAVAEAGGAAAAYWTATGLVVAGLAAIAALIPPTEGAATGPAWRPPRGRLLWATLAAGASWGAYNGALGMVFGFGPAMLAERGLSAVAAGAATSVALWTMAAAIPLGGALADRGGVRGAVLHGGFAAFAAGLLVAGASAGTWLPPAVAFGALGLAGGLAAGPCMGLAGPPLSAETRAAGMGLFFTVYYVCVLASPLLGGWAAEAAGGAAGAFSAGAALLAVAAATALASRRLCRPDREWITAR